MTRRNLDQRRAYYYAESEELIANHRTRKCEMPCSCVKLYGTLRRKYLEQRDDLEPEEIKQIIDSLMTDEYRIDRVRSDYVYRAHPMNPLKGYGLPGGHSALC